MEPVFADPFANAGRLVLNVLAVAGAFAIGYFLTFLAQRLVCRWTFRRQLPVTMARAIQTIGGILLAVLVALWVFGDGGWGFGGSGGFNPGGPGGDAQQQPKEDQPRDEDAKDLDLIPSAKMRIVIAKASDFPKTFRFEGDPDALDLNRAKEKVRQQQEASKGKLESIELIVYRNSTSADHPVVRDFVAFVNEIQVHTRVDKLDANLD